MTEENGHEISGCGLYSSDSRQGPIMGSCKKGKAHLDSRKWGKFLYQTSDYLLFKKECAPWGNLFTHTSWTYVYKSKLNYIFKFIGMSFYSE
jgi:hypothetical protein